MRYLACLPMYHFAQTAKSEAMFAADIAQRLSFPLRWIAPADLDYATAELALSMSCWGPINAGLMPPVRILAQLDYTGVLGGQGAYYRSAIITRGQGRRLPPPASGPLIPRLTGRFAFNEIGSRSGLIALAEDMGLTPQSLAQTGLQTGAHLGSLRAVASGRADFAAIDCMTLHILEKFEPACGQIDIIGWTAPRLGLPYICNPKLPDNVAAELSSALFSLGALAAET